MKRLKGQKYAVQPRVFSIKIISIEIKSMQSNQDNRTVDMTVLHIAPTPFFSDRGCHMRIKGIISSLNKKDINNILCTYHHGRKIPGIEIVRIPHIPGYTKEEAGPSPFKYIADILLFFKVWVIVWKKNPKIIHAHLHEGALIGWAARSCFFWKKIPLIFDVQGSLVGELATHGYFKKSNLLKQIFWRMEYFITRLPDYFICSSQNSANILCTEFNVTLERIAVVNDGVDVDRADIASTDQLRGQFALPANRPIIIYTGAFLESKGLKSLQKIILETHRRRINCYFMLIGYPEQEMKDFINNHSLQHFCKIIGRVPFERLGDYLGIATIAVEPKSSASGEASGKLLNYMGAGLPVVCFDTENNRQILAESGNYAPPGSIEKLVDHIEMIIKVPENGRRLGASGQERVFEFFSWDAGADKIYSIYRKSLSKKK